MKSKLLISILCSSFLLSSCDDATYASQNISKDADNFKVMRRVVFYNGITDSYILELEGYCSIKVDSVEQQLEVVCKRGEGKYEKHFLGFSDNVTYTVEQMQAINASPYHYKIVFKPKSILPLQNIEVR